MQRVIAYSQGLPQYKNWLYIDMSKFNNPLISWSLWAVSRFNLYIKKMIFWNTCFENKYNLFKENRLLFTKLIAKLLKW